MSESGKEVEIYRKLGALKPANWEDLCIYKVPSKLRKVQNDAYNPRVVSIGPFHRKNPDLVVAMREYKWRYMRSFVQQTDDPKESEKFVKEMLEALRGKDHEVRACYAEEIEQNEEELAEIMLLDGCFILELFLRYDKELNYINSEEADPILKSAWIIASLRQDLALLENQIPFFILKTLYSASLPRLGMKCELPSSVASLALNFFHPYLRGEKSTKEGQPGTIRKNDEFKHLLDLLHKFYFFPAQADHVIRMTSDNGRRPDTSEPDSKNNKKWGFNYCASELRESGIVFQTTEDHCLLNIRFNNGVLIIPQLLIHETTSSLFRNLIAYEQWSLGSMHVVTSYVFLMTSLIRSASDSKLLRGKGIIEHKRIEDKEYLVQFQSISEAVVKENFYFGILCDEVNNYCQSCCNLRKLQVFLRVKFFRDMKLLYCTYFSSTWSFISFLAAVALLVLTCLQTYYTMNPRS